MLKYVLCGILAGGFMLVDTQVTQVVKEAEAQRGRVVIRTPYRGRGPAVRYTPPRRGFYYGPGPRYNHGRNFYRGPGRSGVYFRF